MNKTIKLAAIAATPILAGASILAAASPAGASTHDCTIARFQCGDFRAVQGPSLIGGVAWTVGGKGRPGDPVVAGLDTAGNPRDDFSAHYFGGGGLTVEYAPGGHRSGEYVGVAVNTYEQDGYTVKVGDLVLMGWNRAWGEKFQVIAAGRIKDDLTGLRVGMAAAGKPLPTVTLGAVWQFQGNNGGN